MAESVRVTVKGADRVASTMRGVSHDLRDLTSLHRDAAGIFTPVAQARAPKISGQLAAATQPAASKAGAGVENHLVYFGPIHYGWSAHNITAQPFVDEAVADTENEWVAAYEDGIQKICDQVKGA